MKTVDKVQGILSEIREMRESLAPKAGELRSVFNEAADRLDVLASKISQAKTGLDCGEGAPIYHVSENGKGLATHHTDWMWCYENPKEAAAEIDRLHERIASLESDEE